MAEGEDRRSRPQSGGGVPMNAEVIARVLGGRKAGAAWMARCPVHDDRNPSLSIADAECGKILVCCHAGCDQRDVLAALWRRGLWQTTSKSNGHFSRRYF